VITLLCVVEAAGGPGGRARGGRGAGGELCGRGACQAGHALQGRKHTRRIPRVCELQHSRNSCIYTLEVVYALGKDEKYLNVASYSAGLGAIFIEIMHGLLHHISIVP